jgi:hypothetical protein
VKRELLNVIRMAIKRRSEGLLGVCPLARYDVTGRDSAGGHYGARRVPVRMVALFLP